MAEEVEFDGLGGNGVEGEARMTCEIDSGTSMDIMLCWGGASWVAAAVGCA